MFHRNLEPGAWIVGWNADWDDDSEDIQGNRHWLFDKLSLTGPDIQRDLMTSQYTKYTHRALPNLDIL
jgi:hypothetical protein